MPVAYNVTEYKWLADGFHEPVLQITKSGQNNVSAKYFNHIPVDLAVETIDNIGNLDIYPNPASDFITLEIPVTMDEICLTISDITGRQITKSSFVRQQRIELPVGQLQKGIYLVRLSDDKQIFSGKFIKY